VSAPVYETLKVFASVDRNAPIVLVLCAMALLGNYILWFENLRLGFRHGVYTMPVGSLLFFLPHDATFVLLFRKWFHEYDHWFPQLWWYGLCITVVMELAFLHMLIRFGRRELLPQLSQRTFVAVVLSLLALASIGWLVVKSVMDDELFLVIFGITVFWCAMFNLGLMARRGSAVGQSVPAWCGYMMMPLFYWPATFLLDPGFISALWIALGFAAVAAGALNLIYIVHLNRRISSAAGASAVALKPAAATAATKS
jgi:hypothetical protein